MLKIVIHAFQLIFDYCIGNIKLSIFTYLFHYLILKFPFSLIFSFFLQSFFNIFSKFINGFKITDIFSKIIIQLRFFLNLNFFYLNLENNLLPGQFFRLIILGKENLYFKFFSYFSAN